MLENYVRKYAKASILASVLMLIVAILLLVAPSETLDFTIIVFGIIIILDGILHVINYFQGDSAQKIISFELVEGIIEIFSGTFIIMYSEQLMIFLQVIFSVWIILKSLILFQISFKIREIKQSGWICMLVISIIGIILGFIIAFNPFESFITMSMLTGIILIIISALEIIDSVVVITKLNKIKK